MHFRKVQTQNFSNFIINQELIWVGYPLLTVKVSLLSEVHVNLCR